MNKRIKQRDSLMSAGSSFGQQVEVLQAIIKRQVDLLESAAHFERLHSQNKIAGASEAAPCGWRVSIPCLIILFCLLLKVQ